jgi:dolichol-phosphate mannosyltransferase
VPMLYAVLRERDAGAVVASRYVTGGGTDAWSVGRWVLSRAGCAVSRPITPVRDAMSGFFLIRRDRALNVSTSIRGFKIGLELLVRSGLESVVEIGYTFVGRNAGGSKMSVAEAVRFARQLVGLYLFRLSAPEPQPRYEAAASSALVYTSRTRAATSGQSY